MKKIKEFTDKQKQRLPDPGYIVSGLKYVDNKIIPYPTVQCVMNGECKYVHWDFGESWETLQWTCCTTRKQLINDPDDIKWYPSHDEMMKAHPEFINEPMGVKAPNDY